MELIGITSPTLILDRKRCLENIRLMFDKAKRSDVIFRPHFKTHQSAEVGQWFRDAGTEAISVSSVRMAYYFANHGWNDITIAFPVNIREINKVNNLAGKIRLNILIVNREMISFLEKNLKYPVGIFLKIDAGYHRTGVPAEDIQEIQATIDQLDGFDQLEFSGFLVHSGHTYKTSSAREILKIHNNTVIKLVNLRDQITHGKNEVLLSLGDTPACSLVDGFEKIDEIRPGNFVFFDLMQYQLGSCSPDQIAVCLAAPVVAKHSDRDEIIVYGGAVHLSKEFITLSSGERSYGSIVQIGDQGWGDFEKDCYVSGLSQEHGIIHTTKDLMDSTEIGDLLGIIPVHSCLTANLMKGYLTLEGEEIEHMERVVIG